MDGNLLGHIKQYIHKNILSGDLVSNSEKLAFIRGVELMLLFYSISPLM
jgi:hypothetical protein